MNSSFFTDISTQDWSIILGVLFTGLAIYYGIAILFILTLQNTLKAISPGNQRMRPGQVWLLLIPLFNLAWAFVTVIRISESIEAEYRYRNRPIEAKPSYNIGLAWSILRCSYFLPILGTFGALAGFICWIIYWVKMSEFKNMIQAMPPADLKDSIIFNEHRY